MGAVSGAALVEFIGSWGVDSWLYPETFVYLAAVISAGPATTSASPWVR